MDRCLIDIETKSPLDIRKTSGYGYARECEIILIAYAWNDEPVRQIDFTDPNRDPLEVMTLLKILTDPNVIKMAHNAAFEWAVFNACGYETPIDQWQDTMAHAMYLSYPASLEAAGKALGLSEDKLKMSEGKTLIRYFCQPTKDGTYRSPSVNPERWGVFKEYNRRDVETEREIQRRLDRFPMPEKEIERWRNDILMNNYGVPIDLQLLRGALYMIAESEAELMAEAKELTGLDNPNSTQQLIPWLTSHECKVTNLTKDTVADALSGGIDATVRRVLEIRQELSKTSVKKYGAIDDALCIDGRVRGISMYYGATRSGRWAGRLIQLQNLTKHHIGTLDEARALVSAGEYSATKMIYGNIYSLLSQIVRTVLVPSDGRKFVVADFSAIEARVIAWLAGEQWVNEVFATHGKIYEATAAQMFHVPIETIVKGHENYDLRQKGKVATLACIAEGQLVLTDQGLVPIEHVALGMRVWDGEEWVSHKGVVFRGEKEVIEYDGLVATGDHIVYIKTEDGTHREVSFGYAAASRSRVEKSGTGGKTIRVVEDINGRAQVRKGLVTMQGPNGIRRVRESGVDVSRKHDARKDQRVSSVQPTAEDTEMVAQTIYGSETAVRESEISGVQELRSEGDTVRVRERNGSGPVYVGGERISDAPKDGNRPNRQRRELCQGESSVGDAKRADAEPKTLKKVPVYDIVDAGPRHRYTVSNCLVHNCGYGGGVNALTAMDPGGMIPDEDKQGIIERWRTANPHIVSLWRDMEDAAVSVVQYGGSKDIRGGLVQLALEVDVLYGLSFMTMRLPSGRKLYYAKPFLKENRFGKMSVHHYGVGTTKKWEEQNTYSGKLTENCIQAIARDCLAVTLDRVKANGWDVVFHVHDEVVIDAPMDLTVDTVCDLMGEPISWAPGLVLKAAGFESPYYKKD